jgi:hypothetical protein
VAAVSHGFDQGRNVSVEANERYLVELQLLDNGGVRLFCGRGTDQREDAKVAVEALVIGWFNYVVALSAEVSRRSGYWGSWDFALAVTDLRGAQALSRFYDLITYGEPTIFTDADYRQAVRASGEQVQRSPRELAGRALGRFVRGLGVIHRWADGFIDPESPDGA